MAWSAPRYSRRQVDAAAESLIHPPSVFDSDNIAAIYGEAGLVLHVVNNWRAAHNWPLYSIRKTLENRAKRIDPLSVTAQRLKRLPSIRAKLQREQHRHLKLTQIEDIGGCRAVVATAMDALALAKTYTARGLLSELYRERDYVARPKPDGYRSIHLVYKYRSDSERYEAFNNLRIEIQIRSQPQHAWATALETVETFARIPLRATSGSMLLRPAKYITLWKRLFVLMSSLIANLEGLSLVPGAPSDMTELVDELGRLDSELRAVNCLEAWSGAVDSLPIMSTTPGAHWFLLQLDPEKKWIKVDSFIEKDSLEAFEKYISAEEPERDAPSTNVVLVSADSISTLKRAYPNYWADTNMFAQILQGAIKGEYVKSRTVRS
jgi:hypothetical protein